MNLENYKEIDGMVFSHEIDEWVTKEEYLDCEYDK